jgi:hypothetical protein
MSRKTLTGRTIGGLSLHVLCRRIEVVCVIIFPQEYLGTLSPEPAANLWHRDLYIAVYP